MEYRIEISPHEKWKDSRAEGVKEETGKFLGIKFDALKTRDVYTVSADISESQAEKIASELANPVIQKSVLGQSDSACDWMVSVGYRPGVTDNIGNSAHEAVGDIIGRKLREDEFIFSSVEYLFFGSELSRNNIQHIANDLLANSLIENISIFSKKEMSSEKIPLILPFVKKVDGGNVEKYNLNVSDEELMEISRKGVLALSLDEMKAIQKYFLTSSCREKYGLSSEPTDVELEVLAQTWSEHCKHKIFAADINYTDENGNTETVNSCFKSYIKKSTKEISEEVDWLVSVFWDNAGVISFNDKLDLVYKVETHNSPSALDPYGGAMTGIVGVNRDPMGTGQGANLITNIWGYCLGSPFTEDEEVPEGLMHPRRLRDGIHKGVIDGGNQSGIPYGYGWEYFDERYLGKPLVYCGTAGTLPKKIKDREGWDKTIKPGDLVVMAGGRIGKDGIHGATFSSEELHGESPTSAVQIGDPITQKKLSDFLYEARDRLLYRFVTDNGAGGLSSSIGEMAETSGGCNIDLKNAPLKYEGLQPWEILVSEAQERMSFAVPSENIKEFKKLAEARDVKISVLGEFTDTGKFHICYNNETVALLDMDFMHNGLPTMKLNAKWTAPSWPEPEINVDNLGKDILSLLSRLNICSNEYKARQYDHEVKGLSVIKPFVGKNRDILSDATVTMPEALSNEGIILSAAILPRYSDIDTYHMMASIIDLAIRKIIAVGGNMEKIAGLDNFCWPDPVQSEKTPDGEYKLAQLVRANKALYDYTKAFKVPCISGKDSMKNDSSRGGKKISIPPTVLFSAISKMDDISKAVSLDAKIPDDDIYVVGITKPELGGSEYFAMLDAVGNKVPELDSAYAIDIYDRISEITDLELANSLHTPALGGLSVAFAKVAAGGELGLDVDLDKIPAENLANCAELLFSESNSRFVMTAPSANSDKIESILKGADYAKVGTVKNEKILSMKSEKFNADVNLELSDIKNSYKSTLADL